MSKYENFKVSFDAAGKGEVVLNGKPLKAVKAISLKSEVGGPTEVTLTLIANVNCIE